MQAILEIRVLVFRQRGARLPRRGWPGLLPVLRVPLQRGQGQDHAQGHIRERRALQHGREPGGHDQPAPARVQGERQRRRAARGACQCHGHRQGLLAHEAGLDAQVRADGLAAVPHAAAARPPGAPAARRPRRAVAHHRVQRGQRDGAVPHGQGLAREQGRRALRIARARGNGAHSQGICQRDGAHLRHREDARRVDREQVRRARPHALPRAGRDRREGRPHELEEEIRGGWPHGRASLLHQWLHDRAWCPGALAQEDRDRGEVLPAAIGREHHERVPRRAHARPGRAAVAHGEDRQHERGVLELHDRPDRVQAMLPEHTGDARQVLQLREHRRRALLPDHGVLPGRQQLERRETARVQGQVPIPARRREHVLVFINFIVIVQNE